MIALTHSVNNSYYFVSFHDNIIFYDQEVIENFCVESLKIALDVYKVEFKIIIFDEVDESFFEFKPDNHLIFCNSLSHFIEQLKAGRFYILSDDIVRVNNYKKCFVSTETKLADAVHLVY